MQTSKRLQKKNASYLKEDAVFEFDKTVTFWPGKRNIKECLADSTLFWKNKDFDWRRRHRWVRGEGKFCGKYRERWQWPWFVI